MSVSSADLKWYLSATGASEGGARSATAVVDATDNNLFPDDSESAAIAGGSKTRKVFSLNDDGVDAYPAHSIWITAQPTNQTASIGLGHDVAADASAAVATLVELGAPAQIALVSNGSDTRTVKVCGLDDAGDPLFETVTLDGTNEVLTAATFSSGYGLLASAISASRTITAKEGSGGSTIGTIGTNQVNCFRWLSAASKSAGLKLPSLPTGQANGLWIKVDWAPDAGAVDANTMRVRTEKL